MGTVAPAISTSSLHHTTLVITKGGANLLWDAPAIGEEVLRWAERVRI